MVMNMDLYLRKADFGDCDLLFDWANDDEVRRNSFNQNKILYGDHVVWFNKVMNSSKYMIFIFLSGSIPLGQVRIEIENGTAVISYSVDRKYRGKHLASKMLTLLENEVINSKLNISKLVGYVKFDNNISKKVFQDLNYNEVLRKDFYEYYKLLSDKVGVW
jgi:RimJ/RimL family protein N-acetyltransferase